MHLHDSKGTIKKYQCISDIIKEFYEIRLDYYHKRYQYLIKKLEYEVMILLAKINFIEGIIDEDIIIFKKDDDEVNQILEDFDLPKISKVNYDDLKENDEKTYDYLLNLSVRTMTKKKIEELSKQSDDKTNELENLKKKTSKDLWREDLNELKKIL